MNLAYFRYYEELNEFLPKSKRKTEFAYSFNENQTVKDAIEALGIPHTEVDLILVNSESVSFSYRMKDGDRISVYPVFESIDITGLTHLRPEPLRDPRFILDVHLGRLAKYLRLCGFDTLFSAYYEDREIIETAATENRIILTRDKGILKNKMVTHGYWIRSQKHEEQLREVFIRFDLRNRITLFTRCIRCNTPVRAVRKEDIITRLQSRTSQFFSEFNLCPFCDRLYWNGSHYDTMKKIIEKITASY
jgi:uncharacterized protein